MAEGRAHQAMSSRQKTSWLLPECSLSPYICNQLEPLPVDHALDEEQLRTSFWSSTDGAESPGRRRLLMRVQSRHFRRGSKPAAARNGEQESDSG